MNPGPRFREARAPLETPPPGSCDGMIHLYGDPARYPVRIADGHYVPPLATLADAERMHDALGISRALIVQPTCYLTDHSLLLDMLARVPAARYRGMALVDDTLSEGDLNRLHEAGIRGARFNFGKAIRLWPSPAEFHRSLERIQALGWYAKVFVWYDELLDLEEELRKLRLPVILDHMAGLDFSKGLDQRAFRFALDLMRRDNWWIMLSNSDRWSATECPWDDSIAFGRAFYDAAPDRCLWGTDWPHVGYTRSMPDDAELLELLYRFLPDQEARQRVLADNPARIFGFD